MDGAIPLGAAPSGDPAKRGPTRGESQPSPGRRPPPPSLGRVCSRRMATLESHGTVEEAAIRMARLGVDTLVVLDDTGEPMGVVTDRDLVVRALARGLAPGETFVAEIMTSPLPPGMDLEFLDLAIQGGNGDQPLVLNDRYEHLSSLLALDDALALLDEEMERRVGPDRKGSDASEPRERRRRRRDTPGKRRPPRAWG